MESEGQKMLQLLCPMGHYQIKGDRCYHQEQLGHPEQFICPICNKPMVWMNELIFRLDIYGKEDSVNKCKLTSIREEKIVYDEKLDAIITYPAKYKIPE